MSGEWTPTPEEAAEDAAILAEMVATFDELSAAAKTAGEVGAQAAVAIATMMGVKPWLLAEVRDRAESASCLDRVAAIGMVLRYAYGALEVPEALYRRVTAGAPDALDALRVHARAMTIQEFGAVYPSALDDVGNMCDDFEAIVKILALGEDAEASNFARLLRTQRDDLESVAVVLDLAGPGHGLRDALEGLDRLASTHLTTFDLLYVDEEEDEHLSAASWASPSGWWTALS